MSVRNLRMYMNVAYILDLPTELLLDIFKLATYGPARDIDSLVSFPRFSSAHATSAKKLCKGALRTKAALSAVCSLIRNLILEFLYEDIWIRHGSDGLLEALESSRKGSQLGLGGYVKRVSLSLSLAVDDEELKPRRSMREIYEVARRILLLCPNVRAISRPQEEEKDDEGEKAVMTSLPIDDIDLPALERVDWYNTPLDLPFANSPTPRFIWTSNSLRVLILGADNFPDLFTPGDNDHDHNHDSDSDSDFDARITINLPNLHTLGIRALNTFSNSHSLHRSHALYLPSLRRLVIGRPEAIYNFYAGCLSPFAPHITHIELEAQEPRFLHHDFVSTLLGHCPNVVELSFSVESTRPVYRRNEEEVMVPPRIVEEYTAVRRVYLHTGFSSSGDESSNIVASSATSVTARPAVHGYDYRGIPWWTLLSEHFEGLCGSRSRFSALERIVLCGEEWKETVLDGRFDGLVRIARIRGVSVECDSAWMKGYNAI